MNDMTQGPGAKAGLQTMHDIEALFALPFTDLMFQAQTVHREHFDPNEVQLSTLLSIKTGGCSEDCGYCPQSAHHDAGVDKQPMMKLDDVRGRRPRRQGRRRFALLHGRGVARTETARPRAGGRNGARGEGAGTGDLRHPGHAEGRPGRATEGSRARLLQPQPRHRARVLRRDHLHPRLPGPARHPGARARGRPEACAAAASSAWASRAPSAPA